MEEEDEHDVLYGDIVTRHGDDGTESMRIAFDQMQKREVTHLRRIEMLEDRVRDVEEENARLKKENETITKNISSLYDTAKRELKRKDEMLMEERMKSHGSIGKVAASGKQQRRAGQNPPPPKPPPGGPPPTRK